MKIKFALIFTTFILNLCSQPSLEWVNRYTSANNASDYAYRIIADEYGNIYVGGTIRENVYDICVIKYASTGTILWVQKYNGPYNGYDIFGDMSLDDSGNVIVTGVVSTDNNLSNFDFCTFKLGFDGIFKWEYVHNGPHYDEAASVTTDNYGNVYATGVSTIAGSGEDYLTFKLNRNGNLIWSRRFSTPNSYSDESLFIKLDHQSNVIVSGCVHGTGWDIGTIKYDSSGNQIWAVFYNGTGNWYDFPYDMAIDPLGNIYVTGESDGVGTGGDYITIKYDPMGNQRWTRRYSASGNNSDAAQCIKINKEFDVFVTGISIGVGTSEDYCTVKYDSAGNEQWIRRYDAANNVDRSLAMTLDSLSNVYVTGYSMGLVGNGDICTIKYLSSGEQSWLARYNSPYNQGEVAYDMITVGLTDIYVTGYSVGVGTGNDFLTLKYSQPNGVNFDPPIVSKTFILFNNYPNPFNPSTNIRYQILESKNVMISVNDISGRQSALLVNKRQSAGTYETKFDGTMFSSGVYFYSLILDNEIIDVKKMVLLK